MSELKNFLDKILISEAPIPSDIRKEALRIRDELRNGVLLKTSEFTSVEYHGKIYKMYELQRCYDLAKEGDGSTLNFKVRFIKNLREKDVEKA